MRIPIAREGYPFFVPPLVVSLLLAGTGRLYPLAGLFLVVGLFLVSFFRDPERTLPDRADCLVAPADGRIVRVQREDDGTTELSIFLSPLDVHINRSPVSATLTKVEYRPGRFLAAYKNDASERNEQLRLQLETPFGGIEMREITGVLVRRIVLWKKAGDVVRAGERIGLMKFGSRVDLRVPATFRVTAAIGQRVRGGETILGEVAT